MFLTWVCVFNTRLCVRSVCSCSVSTFVIGKYLVSKALVLFWTWIDKLSFHSPFFYLVKICFYLIILFHSLSLTCINYPARLLKKNMMEWYRQRDEFEVPVDFKYLRFDACSHKGTREIKMYWTNEVLHWKKILLELNFCVYSSTGI